MFKRASKRLKKEAKFLSKLELRDRIIYDIGSYIGILTIFFAKSAGKSGRVIAFEPNTVNYKKLKTNIRLNELKNVGIINIGIGDKQETKNLAVHPFACATGSMEENIQAEILHDSDPKTMLVEVDTLDNCIKEIKLPKPDFIKIDIEGMEYAALIGMKEAINKYKPLLYIEIHGANEERKLSNIKRIFEFLYLHRYTIYHIESKQMVKSENIQIAKAGHIYCR